MASWYHVRGERMNEANLARSRAMMGNSHAKGHGGKGRRTIRHYTAPNADRAPIELERILDRIERIG